MVKDGEAGEDDGRRAEKELDDLTHRYVAARRRAGQAQGSRAARGLMTDREPRRPATRRRPAATGSARRCRGVSAAELMPGPRRPRRSAGQRSSRSAGGASPTSRAGTATLVTRSARAQTRPPPPLTPKRQRTTRRRDPGRRGARSARRRSPSRRASAGPGATCRPRSASASALALLVLGLAGCVWRAAFLGRARVAVGVGIWEMARAVGTAARARRWCRCSPAALAMTRLAWSAAPDGAGRRPAADRAGRDWSGGWPTGRPGTSGTSTAVAGRGLRAVPGRLRRACWPRRTTATCGRAGHADGRRAVRHRRVRGRRASSAGTRWRPPVSPKKSWEGFAGSVCWPARRQARCCCASARRCRWWGALFGVGDRRSPPCWATWPSR